jgi:hypothetical protein
MESPWRDPRDFNRSPMYASIRSLATSKVSLASNSVAKLQRPIVLLLASICFGLLSWSLLGQIYRVAIENLKLGYDPWYGSLLLPATLVTGVAGAAIAYRGHRNEFLNHDPSSRARRFQLAGWFSLAPTIIIVLLWLAS